MQTIIIGTTPYVSVLGAAKICGVTDARIRQLRESRALRSVRIDNRTWLVSLADVEQFAQNPPKIGRPRGSLEKTS